jgi:DNA gyrase subunit B
VGKIFIAAPPLYKVKRKKREKYVHNEKLLRITMVELSLVDASLNCNGDKKVIAGDELLGLIKDLIALEEFSTHITKERRGLNFEDYLHLYDMEKETLPQFRVVARDGEERFFSSPEKLDAFFEKAAAEKGEELLIGTEVKNDGKDFVVFEFLEHRDIERAFLKIRERGFSWKDYCGNTDKSRFTLKVGETTHECDSLRGVFKVALDISQKDIDIQRYKGLGEMNPEQLWESTMDPERRTLHEVKMEDEVEADTIFNILMGPGVEPRRDFIEKHALEVKNLDV